MTTSGVSKNYVKSSLVGKFKVMKCRYHWTIHTEYLDRYRESWYSPSFTIEGCAGLKWYFNSRHCEIPNSRTLELYGSFLGPRAIMTKCELSSARSDTSGNFTKLYIEPFPGSKVSDYITFFIANMKKSYSSHDGVCISCEFQIIMLDGKNATIERLTLLQDIKSALENGTNADVILQTENKTLKAHKAILSARSSVFATMFSTDMKEKENKVDITDITAEVLEELLKFIYTGETPMLETMATDLLFAADKYNISRLKSMCEQYLFESVTIDTAGELLVFADSNNFVELKKKLLQFINRYRKEFVKTKKYPEFCASYKDLIVELFQVAE